MEGKYCHCRIVRNVRGVSRRTLETIDPDLYLQKLGQSKSPKMDTFQLQMAEEQRIQNLKAKPKPKLEQFDDPRVEKIQTFLTAVGKRTDNFLVNKIKYFPSVSDELRSYDQFSHTTNLDQIRGLKVEHRKIGDIFQTLDKNWKTIKLKSDRQTKQIAVVCTLKIEDQNPDQVNELIEEMNVKIEPFCTTLFSFAVQTSKSEMSYVQNIDQKF